MNNEQIKMSDLSIAQCCWSCKHHQFSWGYEESRCNLYNVEVSFALICHNYKPKENSRILAVISGFTINWDLEK